MLLAQCWVGDEQPLVEQQFPEQNLALSQGPAAWAPPVKELKKAEELLLPLLLDTSRGAVNISQVL